MHTSAALEGLTMQPPFAALGSKTEKLLCFVATTSLPCGVLRFIDMVAPMGFGVPFGK